MQDGDIVADGAEPAERNGDCLAAAELFMDIPCRFRRRHLLTALSHQPHFTCIGRAGLIGEQNPVCRRDAYLSDTHRVDDSAPVEVRLIVVKRIVVLRTTEMRISG